jgi:hypothetical protein
MGVRRALGWTDWAQLGGFFSGDRRHWSRGSSGGRVWGGKNHGVF